MKIYNPSHQYPLHCHECDTQTDTGIYFQLNKTFSQKENREFFVCLECIEEGKLMLEKSIADHPYGIEEEESKPITAVKNHWISVDHDMPHIKTSCLAGTPDLLYSKQVFFKDSKGEIYLGRWERFISDEHGNWRTVGDGGIVLDVEYWREV